MSGTFIPIWIIGAPAIGIIILSFSFKGSSSMSGRGLRSDDPLDSLDRNRAASY